MAGASVKWRIHRFDEVQMEVMPHVGLEIEILVLSQANRRSGP
jgi:hypothetical protein